MAKKTGDTKLLIFMSEFFHEAEHLGLIASQSNEGETDFVLTGLDIRVHLKCSISNNRGRPKVAKRRSLRGIEDGTDIDADLTWDSNSVKYTAFVKGFFYAHPTEAETLEGIVSLIRKQMDSYESIKNDLEPDASEEQ